ncbi:MBL fold metallo-hydrolase [Halomarina pelagica]|uniref:MBL fold metallo-hydrolase n=1 Tax=Halomarina pelagica TaxID=2961599 RepID=UPI0020C1D582|nr:MBL fold metallo-hydrolase [Halomarina sp. BND7]
MPPEYDGLTFTRPGHATVRIQSDDLFAYVDPWSDVVDGRPADADLVFVTHDDYDHYDPDGIEAVSTPETTVVVYEGVDATDLDRDVRSLAADEEFTVEGVTARAVPAYNDPEGEHVREPGVPYHAEGEGIGLLFDFDGATILVPSDTDFLPVHRELSAAVVLPPIGGTYTMDRREAADLAAAVGASLVLPVHYDTFEAIETDAEAFVEDVRARGMDAVLF